MQSLKVFAALLLLSVICQCNSAPVVESSSGEADTDSVETYNDRGGDTRTREGRFFKDVYFPGYSSGINPYYQDPYYYNYQSHAPQYYQPVFKYRQARRKRKRLFVPNFWG